MRKNMNRRKVVGPAERERSSGFYFMSFFAIITAYEKNEGLSTHCISIETERQLPVMRRRHPCRPQTILHD